MMCILLQHTHTQNTVSSAPNKAISAVKNIQSSSNIKLPTKMPSLKF